MTALVLKGAKSRTPYTLGPAFARGGEGTVHDIAGRSDKVAKIYLKPMDRVHTEKLAHLVKLASPQLTSVSAWPEELLLDSRGAGVGFVMPAVRDGRPVHLYASPADRQRYAPHATYASLVAVAANLGRAVMNFHHAGVVLSDINCSNMLVRPDGTVRVIDCDSVQIGTKAKFRATVAMQEFVPPELQGRRVADHARTPDHDNFGLSVLIFQLLVQGRHPFSGAGALSLGDSIAQRLHPFRSHRGRTCPFCVLGLKPTEVLSDEVVGLFKASFEGGRMLSAYRPTAKQWVSALTALSQALVTCAANPTHGYTRAARACPWCRLEAKGLPALFQPTIRSRLPPPPKRPSLLGRLFGT